MIDTSTPVVVLRSGQHGGLAVSRSLGRLGVPVDIVDANPQSPSFLSRYCQGRFVWDLDRAPAQASFEYLADIGRRRGRRAILIPTTNTAALFVAANASALREWFIFPNLSSHLAQSLYSKKEMHFLAKSAGIPTPNTFFPECKQAVLEFAEAARFPIILKAIEDPALLPWLSPTLRGWGRLIRILDDSELRRRQSKNPAACGKAIVGGMHELLGAYEIMANPEHPNVLMQEYIPGGEETSWMFNGYFDENSECLFGLTGAKIRQNPPYAGVTSLGICRPNALLAETTKKFMKTIGYRGILDIGYRYDARDGLYKVVYVNPRVGCAFRLFVSDNGMDVTRALYLNLTDQPIVAGGALPGRKWIVEDMDLASSLRYWHDGKLSPLEWVRSFKGLGECALFSADDLRPMVSTYLNHFGEFFHRLRKEQGVIPCIKDSKSLPITADRSSGTVSTGEARRIALLFTGQKHVGKNRPMS